MPPTPTSGRCVLASASSSPLARLARPKGAGWFAKPTATSSPRSQGPSWGRTPTPSKTPGTLLKPPLKASQTNLKH
eukprot:8384709-Heterocapsa_arctica.AAC.1